MNGAPPYIKDSEPAYEVSWWALILAFIGAAGVLELIFLLGFFVGGAC